MRRAYSIGKAWVPLTVRETAEVDRLMDLAHPWYGPHGEKRARDVAKGK